MDNGEHGAGLAGALGVQQGFQRGILGEVGLHAGEELSGRHFSSEAGLLADLQRLFNNAVEIGVVSRNTLHKLGVGAVDVLVELTLKRLNRQAELGVRAGQVSLLLDEAAEHVQLVAHIDAGLGAQSKPVADVAVETGDTLSFSVELGLTVHDLDVGFGQTAVNAGECLGGEHTKHKLGRVFLTGQRQVINPQVAVNPGLTTEFAGGDR